MDISVKRIRKNRIGRGLNFEKVWATIERNAEEARERHKETERLMQETRESQKETDRQMQETDRQMQETDRMMKETDRKMQETSRKMDMLNEQMGGLHNSFGEMAEHLVAPGIVERFNEMGFHIKEAAMHGFKIFDENRKIKTEIDLLMGNGEYIIAVEVKAKLGEKDIEKHQKRLEILREDKDMTGDRRKILGGMAVAILGTGDKEAILNAGFYVLVQTGDTMKLDLPENFTPREW